MAVVKEVPLACVQRAVWGMFYTDEAGIVLKSAEGLDKMMAVLATVFEAASLTLSERNTETMLLRTTDSTSLPTPLYLCHRSSWLEVGVDRRDMYYIWPALSTKALACPSKSDDGPT